MLSMDRTSAVVKYGQPAIAMGCEPSTGLKLSHREAVILWKAIHGEPEVRKQQERKLHKSNLPKIPTSRTKHYYIGASNHRRPGSLGGAFVDYLVSNPGATEAMIKAAGHDLKHLRWDLKENPELFECK